MALERIQFADNRKHPHVAERGDFTFTLRFTPGTNLAAQRAWVGDVLRHPSAEGLFPGAVLQVSNDALLFTLHDHDKKASQDVRALDLTNRFAISDIARAQRACKQNIALPLEQAFMGALMQRLVSSREMTMEDAITMTRETLGISADDAYGAIRKAAIYASRANERGGRS